MYDGHWLGGGMWIFWFALIIFVLWGAKAFNDNNTAEKQTSALDILKERYARGEIDQQEYEAKKRDLI